MIHKVFSFLTLLFLIVQISCTKRGSDPQPTPPSPPSSTKIITSFTCTKIDNPLLMADVFGVIDGDTIRLIFPLSTPLNSVIPTIIFSGNSINPANRAAQNFSTIVTYTVTAEDRTTKNYFVKSTLLASNAKNITSFIFKSANNPAILADINGVIGTDSIIVKVPFGTNVTALIPTIAITGISILPSNLSQQNFTSTRPYIVTAEDGTTKTYIVAVTYEPNSGTLYINSQNIHSSGNGVGSLYALDPNTGSLKWKYTATNASHTSSVAFYNGLLYSGMANNLTVIDTATRSIRWQYATGGMIYSTPTVANGTVYFNSDDRFLYALNAATGTLKWKYQQGVFSSGGNYSSPTIVNGVVYVGSRDGYVYAIDEVTGTLKWKSSYSPGASMQSSPSVVNGVVYIGYGSYDFLAINATDGSLKWTFTGSSLFFSSPTVANGIVYIGCANGQLYAVDAITGIVRWTYASFSQIYGSPIVSNGVVYFGQNNSNGSYLYALDAISGSLKWMYRHDNELFSSPVVFDGAVYVGSITCVIAVNINTGLLKWKFAVADNFEDFGSSPCVVDKQGNIYLSGISGSQN